MTRVEDSPKFENVKTDVKMARKRPHFRRPAGYGHSKLTSHNEAYKTNKHVEDMHKCLDMCCSFEPQKAQAFQMPRAISIASPKWRHHHKRASAETSVPLNRLQVSYSNDKAIKRRRSSLRSVASALIVTLTLLSWKSAAVAYDSMANTMSHGPLLSDYSSRKH